MKSSLAALVRGHYRLGYSAPLLVLDALLILLCFADFLRFASDGYSLGAALMLLSGDWSEPLAPALILVLFLLLVAPIPIAAWRSIGFGRSMFYGRLASRPSLVLCIHLLLAVCLVYCTLAAHGMERLSGYEQAQKTYWLSFNSYFYSLVSAPWLSGTLTWLAGLIYLGGSFLVGYVLLGQDLPSPIQQYLKHLELADLPTELLPHRTTSRSTGGPKVTGYQVELVVRRELHQLAEQARLGAGSAESIRLLDNLFASVKKSVLDHLMEPGGVAGQPAPDMGLFTGTARAFEAALGWIPGPRTIVLSPYGTPSLYSLAKWREATMGDRVIPIEFRPDEHLLEWREQEAILLREVAKARNAQMAMAASVGGGSVTGAAAGHVVLLLSEVSYATGLRLPLRRLLPRLRSEAGALPLSVVVDGTNAVGNRGLIPGDVDWDFYVFAPHRWLLCRQRCGVLLSRRPLGDGPPAPPNSWRMGENKTAAQRAIISGFSAALSLMDGQEFQLLRNRAEELRSYLRLNLPRNFEVVGVNRGMEDSFVFAVRPSLGHSWKWNAGELNQRLRTADYPASVLVLEPANPWVRIAVASFADVRDLNRLCTFLDASIT